MTASSLSLRSGQTVLHFGTPVIASRRDPVRRCVPDERRRSFAVRTTIAALRAFTVALGQEIAHPLAGGHDAVAGGAAGQRAADRTQHGPAGWHSRRLVIDLNLTLLLTRRVLADRDTAAFRLTPFPGNSRLRQAVAALSASLQKDNL